jgi:hypothetical protein
MSIVYVSPLLTCFLREKILATGPIFDSVAHKTFAKPFIFSNDIAAQIKYSDLDIGGVISPTESDVELVDSICSTSQAEMDSIVICHDPYAAIGDLAYIGPLPSHIVESSSGNYHIATASGLTSDFVGQFGNISVSYNKIVYLVYNYGSISGVRKSLASNIFDGTVQAVFVNCFDDESWSGSYPNATASIYGAN